MARERSKGERNMLEIQGKVKRQIEILGLAVDNPERLRDVDLAASRLAVGSHDSLRGARFVRCAAAGARHRRTGTGRSRLSRREVVL